VPVAHAGRVFDKEVGEPVGELGPLDVAELDAAAGGGGDVAGEGLGFLGEGRRAARAAVGGGAARRAGRAPVSLLLPTAPTG